MEIKKIHQISGIFLLLIFFSCSHKDEQKNHTIVVNGTSQDIFRNVASPDITVNLFEIHSQNTYPNHTYGVKVDSTTSDINGKFKLEYQAKNDINYFVTIENNPNNNKPYKIEILNNNEFEIYQNRIYIEPDTDININVNAYIPSILKVNVSVINNINHNLTSFASLAPGSLPFDPDRKVTIRSENIDTLYYLTARPDSDMIMYFKYFANTNACTACYKTFDLHTNTNDTIPLSYTIDCNTF